MGDWVYTSRDRGTVGVEDRIRVKAGLGTRVGAKRHSLGHVGEVCAALPRDGIIGHGYNKTLGSRVTGRTKTRAEG